MTARHPLAREALLSAAAAGTLAALLAWLGPPGTDLAAHAYQRTLFLHHGFTLWNNFWYAGRYSFVTYSLLYYPLAALLGIKLLAVATIALAALAFAVVLWNEWGPATRWSGRTFAVVWAGIVLSAAFPFALGIAFALVGLWALQAGARWRFCGLAALTLAASPVAFLLLVVVLGGVALARRPRLVPVAAVVAAALVELVLWRLFPGGGQFPFSFVEAAAAVLFCALGIVFTWRVERARVLRYFFAVYLVACVGLYVVPSAVGENVVRLRYVAIPLAVLVFSLRDWRPRGAAFVVLLLASSFNVSPLVSSYLNGSSDATANAHAWRGAIAYLHAHLGPAYRVEAVDTVTHSPAVYLGDAQIPLARGWFRQDDFPENAVLYRKPGMRAYLHWLHSLGVEYVVLPHAKADYSSRAEARLVRRLRPVYRGGAVTVYAVPRPRPIAPGLRALTESQISIGVRHAGTVRIAVRYSPYWHASDGCLSQGPDGMLRLTNRGPRLVTIVFDVSASRAFGALTGARRTCS
ncbi:MAG TPA: hypothetical protein VFL60_06685 [Gaiellaceae bacterium]|nr:hypothetical protein [Gaiellaceae bacterium]